MSKKRRDKQERYTPPADSMPQGEGWMRIWKPRPGATFLAQGAMVRSIVDAGNAKGLVAMDIGGKWNHGAEDTLSMLGDPEWARDFAKGLVLAADAAERDEKRFEAMT